MKAEEPVGQARMEAFLKNMLVDSEGHREEAKFTKWMRMKVSEEDLVLRSYSEGAHPFQQPSDDHGAAYAVAMEAMVLLRHWWFETIDYYGELPYGEALTAMANDAVCVAGYIESHAQTLRELADLPQQAEVEKLNASLRDAQKVLAAQERKMNQLRALVRRHEAKQALQGILTEGPNEQLARVAEDYNSTSPDLPAASHNQEEE
jgi:hypothetical protein